MVDKYKQDNGFLPVMLELGDTLSINQEHSVVIFDAMYEIFDKMGLDAVLVTSEELKDSEQYFAKRMQNGIPHVLSNVSPKDNDKGNDRPFGKLRQAFKKDIPGVGNLYVVNLVHPSEIQWVELIKNHYDLMEPEHFLKEFVAQVSASDVVVARLMIYNKDYVKKILETPEAKRVDFFIVPPNPANEFLLDEEKALTRSNFGWIPSKEPPPSKEEKKEAQQQAPPELVGPPVNPENAFKPGGTQDSGEKVNPDGTVEPSANQGGERTSQDNPESANPNPASADDASQPIITNDPSQLFNPPHEAPLPPPQNPLPKPEINLKVKDRQYMEIKNKYSVVPYIFSAESMREVHFTRTFDGRKIIEVSDIIIYENTPEDPEIKEIADTSQERADALRERERIFITARNQQNTIKYKQTNPYVGPEKCQECHQVSYDIWKSSAHFKAFDTLKRKNSQKNEECMKCHLTQWTPPQPDWQNWTYDAFAPELGCEACHGAGLAHVEFVDLMSVNVNRKYWNDVKIEFPYLLTDGPLSKNTCLKCHDKANSPEFDFVKYWDKILHDEPEALEPPPEKPKPVEPVKVIPGQTTPIQHQHEIEPTKKPDEPPKSQQEARKEEQDGSEPEKK